MAAPFPEEHLHGRSCSAQDILPLHSPGCDVSLSTAVICNLIWATTRPGDANPSQPMPSVHPHSPSHACPDCDPKHHPPAHRGHQALVSPQQGSLPEAEAAFQPHATLLLMTHTHLPPCLLHLEEQRPLLKSWSPQQPGRLRAGQTLLLPSSQAKHTAADSSSPLLL